VYPPTYALYSTVPTATWLQHEYPQLPLDERPIEFEQLAGDIVRRNCVPFLAPRGLVARGDYSVLLEECSSS
jgi:hypothetical protein